MTEVTSVDIATSANTDHPHVTLTLKRSDGTEEAVLMSGETFRNLISDGMTIVSDWNVRKALGEMLSD